VKNNIGHDSKLQIDGEMTEVEQFYSGEFPFGDRRDERIADLEEVLTGLAEWCLKQVSQIDAGLLINPDDDFWRGNKTAYQLVAIEICAMLDGES